MAGLRVIDGTPTAIAKFIREEEAKSQETPAETRYLKFKLVEQKEKTQVWEILSKTHDYRLGIIKWYGSWRQYCFFPEPGTVFNTDCMEDIQDFIVDLKTEREK